MAERRRYAETVSYICHLNLEEGTNHLDRHIGFHCHAIPQDRDRFLATLNTKSINGDQVVFDPEVFCILIAKYLISEEIAFRKADDPNWKLYKILSAIV